MLHDESIMMPIKLKQVRFLFAPTTRTGSLEELVGAIVVVVPVLGGSQMTKLQVDSLQ